MNEKPKPVKVDIAFNEALRRIATTPKSAISTKAELKKTAPPTKRGAVKTKLAKQR